MTFNNSRKFIFPSEFSLGNADILQEKTTMKLLGVMIQNDLRWEAQVAHMVTKASKKIWLLRRMRQLGVDEKTITTYWVMEGRVHLEAAVPVWAGALTSSQARDLTRVQRRAVAAITGRTTRAQWCQHLEKVSGPVNTSEQPNLSEVCFLALFLWL